MISRRTVVILTCIVLIVAGLLQPHPSIAQQVAQAKALKYGDTVEGMITKTDYEVHYTFTGKRDDVTMVQMFPIKDAKGDYFTSFEMIIRDSQNKKIADSADVLIFFDSSTRTVGVQLPDDGTYTLIATRLNGADGSGVGKYGLTLFLAEPLIPGKPVKGSATQLDAGRYHAFYTINSLDDFSLKYKRVEKGFSPLVIVGHLEAGYLRTDAVMGGGRLTTGVLDIEGDRNFYVVGVADGDLSRFFKDKSGLDWEITLNEGVGGLSK